LLPPAGLDTNTADVLADVISFPEEAELFKTHAMFKVLLPCPDGPCRTYRETGRAGMATILDGMVVVQGQISQNGDQPEMCTVGGIDQQIISAHPAETCFKRYLFMGEVCRLMLPIDNLGGRYREGTISLFLNELGKEKGNTVKKKVSLTVVVEIELCRPVLDVLEDGIS